MIGSKESQNGLGNLQLVEGKTQCLTQLTGQGGIYESQRFSQKDHFGGK